MIVLIDVCRGVKFTISFSHLGGYGRTDKPAPIHYTFSRRPTFSDSDVMEYTMEQQDVFSTVTIKSSGMFYHTLMALISRERGYTDSLFGDGAVISEIDAIKRIADETGFTELKSHILHYYEDTVFNHDAIILYIRMNIARGSSVIIKTQDGETISVGIRSNKITVICGDYKVTSNLSTGKLKAVHYSDVESDDDSPGVCGKYSATTEAEFYRENAGMLARMVERMNMIFRGKITGSAILAVIRQYFPVNF